MRHTQGHSQADSPTRRELHTHLLALIRGLLFQLSRANQMRGGDVALGPVFQALQALGEGMGDLGIDAQFQPQLVEDWIGAYVAPRCPRCHCRMRCRLRRDIALTLRCVCVVGRANTGAPTALVG